MDNKNKIIRLAILKSEALVKRDVKALEGLLHEDFQYTNSHGMTYDRKSYIGLFKGPSEMGFKSQDYKDISVSVHGDIAILEASITDCFTYQGKERKGRYRTMMIFFLEGDGWKWLRGMTVETA